MPINTRMHGVMDYLMAIVLMAAPWIFGFAGNGPETWIPVALGLGVILYSLMTNYEAGLFRVLPMSAHLILDAAGGILLAASPWLFGFADVVWLPHLLFGLAEVGAAAMTERRSSTEMIPHSPMRL